MEYGTADRCYLFQLFLSDGGAGFSSKHGWTRGERTGRYALIIDHGKVVYAENEPGSDVTVRHSMNLLL